MRAFLQSRRIVPVLAAGMLLLVAGCGGSSKHAATSASTSTATTTTTAAPRRVPVTVSVLDGDTGKAIQGATVTAKGAAARGLALLVAPRLKTLTVTSSAPHYDATTVTQTLDATRHITIQLYRPDGQWLMYGVTPARTQVHEAIPIRPPFKTVWSKYLGTLLEFPAVVDEGVAYISNLHGQLFALSMKNGHTIWHIDMHTREEDSSPAVVGDALVAHVKAGRVLVLDRATGHIRWSFATNGEVESSPVVEDGVDYLADWAGEVYALDLKTHKPRWTYDDGGCKITASVAISGNTLFLGDYCGREIALDKTTGKLLWSESAGGVVYGTSAVSDGRVFVPSRAAEALYAFKTDGTYLWHVSAGGLVYSAPAVWQGRVYFGSYTGELYCVSAVTGSVLWTLDTHGEISGSPTVVDGIVYTGTFSHTIIGADARTGHQVFSFPHGEYVAVSGNRGKLLLYGWASIYAVEPRRG